MRKPEWFVSVLAAVVILALPAQSQDAGAYEEDEGEKKALLDPSRLTVNHSLSFGMSKAGSQSMQSQSLATTMLQYEFSAPLTLNLNFGMPIHSTAFGSHNLNQHNLQSADYFRTMPIDASLTWRPTENTMMRISVIRNASDNTAYPSYLLPSEIFQRD
jgi:hypothetical protein